MDLFLDIAEPGQSPRPHAPRPEKRLVVGIDLGTTYSLVAAITPEGPPTCIPDDEGRLLFPSVVHYAADGSLLVGHAARELATLHPQETILSAKSCMGRGLKELQEGSRHTPYQLENGEGGMVRFLVHERPVSPVEVSAEVLKALKLRAEKSLGGPLHGAVVTVPAYFDDAQRQATKDACRLAGLEVLRLVNEPTAAALAYGLEQGQEGIYAIYDLGGGTFDISILKLTRGVFQVLATGGNSALGGDDFDQALGQRLLHACRVEEPSASMQQAVRQAARLTKEALSQAETWVATFPLPDGTPFRHEVTRGEFEAAIAPLVRLTGQPCRRALKDAGVQAGELNGVVLVGGSTRVPSVRRFVAELFGLEPLCDLDPDQVVALGAAHQADLLAGGGRADLLLLDVSPLSLGIETMGDLVERIIPRNSPIPTARAQEFTTFKDGQSAMAIHVVQGERELVSQCRSLARFELRGIPPMAAGAARVRVTFRVDADGLLTVSAAEATTGVEQSVEVKPSYGLSDAEVERMLRDALEHGVEDLKARVLAEAKVEAERVLAALGAALKQDGDLLNEEELRHLKKEMLLLWETTRGADHQAINEAVAQMDRESRFFAQRRMDRSVQAAMAGHKLEEFE